MGCTSCGTGGCGSTGGCGKNGGCATGGCNKLNTFDWFNGMQQPNQTEFENIYEVRFKNTRKRFYRNVNGIPVITGDFVVVESDRGFDLGQISLGGILAQLQMKKRKINKNSDRVRKIYRIATKDDLAKLRKARAREQETLVRTREIVRELDLDMKISDVEFQGDNTKAIFYYIADQRVDFRELIKQLANEFRIRVEMKQIGLRHESGLVGGIGSCGRELCCSTWLTDFKSVSTAAARFQNLSLNPMKISGQCGRLKCCLNFELETYMDALEDIPKVEKIDTQAGIASRQKTDIFKRIMWFSYERETTWVPVSVDHVIEMAKMNRNGEKPASLRALESPEDLLAEESIDFVDVVGQSTLREDPKRRRKGKGKGKGKGRGNGKRRGPEGRSGNDGPRGRGGKGGDKNAKGGSRNGKGGSGNRGRNQSGGKQEGGENRGGDNRKRGQGGGNQKNSKGRSDNKGRNNRGPSNKGEGQGGRGNRGGGNKGPKGEGNQKRGDGNKGPRGEGNKKQGGGNKGGGKPRGEGKNSGNRNNSKKNEGAGNQPKP